MLCSSGGKALPGEERDGDCGQWVSQGCRQGPRQEYLQQGTQREQTWGWDESA